MRAALIHYNVDRIPNEPGNKTVMKHFGIMPSIQLLYVAAILRKLGARLQYHDIEATGISRPEMEERLERFDPDLVGLSVYTSHFQNASAWARHLKSFLPRAKIMMGGMHAQIFPTETLRYNPAVDFVCAGEAEMVLPGFVDRLNAGADFDGLRGLVWRRGGEIVYAGPPDLCQDLDSVPFPARDLVPNERYFSFISRRRNYTVFSSSRGCPFRCIFCEAQGTRWRPRSAANVVAEFEECHERHGIREIDIFDSSFTVSRRRVLDACHRLVQSGLSTKLLWDVRSRVDSVDEEVLEALKAAGCYRIFYGIESANPSVLEALHKQIEIGRLCEVIRQTDRLGISAFGYFLLGAPGETRQTARETIDFAKTLPLDFAIFNCLTAFPKTELYEKHYLPAAGHDFWAEQIARPEPSAEFMGRPWTEIPDAELRRLAHRAMNEFYFRPRQLGRAIRSVKSFDQLSRYVRAGWDMLWSYFRRG